MWSFQIQFFFNGKFILREIHHLRCVSGKYAIHDCIKKAIHYLMITRKERIEHHNTRKFSAGIQPSFSVLILHPWKGAHFTSRATFVSSQRL